MLTRWEPFGGIRRRGDLFGDLTRMQEDMNRFFDDFFGEHRRGLAEGAWLSAVDVSETENEFVVRAELPGVDKKDLEVTLSEDALTIKGSTKAEKEEEKGDYYRREVSSGSFSRTIRLPTAVDGDKVTSSFKDGILELTLPKVTKAKRHTIKVE